MSAEQGTVTMRTGMPAGQAFLALLGVFVLVFASSWQNLLVFWWQSSTYSYALLLLPLAAASGFQRWRRYRHLYAGPCYNALWLLAALTLMWLMARIANVRVVEYLATVAFVPALFLYFWNWPLTRRLLFPFTLLLFTVPFWDLLLNLSLQRIAAHATVFLLDLVGVPTYLEGLSVVLPNGRFDVEEGCSGLNFLLVSFALSTLYASHMYNRDSKRLRYIAVFAAAAVLGNIARVFAITLLGYLTDLQHPLVRDHAIIGWLIFALIAAGMFYFGRRWADARPPVTPVSTSLPVLARHRLWRIMALAVLAMVSGPLVLVASGRVSAPDHAHLDLPAARAGIVGPLVSRDSWQPVYHGDTRRWRAAYRDGTETVEVFAAYYARQRQGAELIHHDNRIVDGQRWASVLAAPTRRHFRGREVDEYLVRGPGGRERLIWRWYVIGGRHTASARLAKLYEVRDVLFAHRGAFVVMVAVDVRRGPDGARAVLEGFLSRFGPLYDFGSKA